MRELGGGVDGGARCHRPPRRSPRRLPAGLRRARHARHAPGREQRGVLGRRVGPRTRRRCRDRPPARAGPTRATSCSSRRREASGWSGSPKPSWPARLSLRSGPAMRLVVIAGAIAAVISLVGTPLLIRLLARHGYAQAIRAVDRGLDLPRPREQARHAVDGRRRDHPRGHRAATSSPTSWSGDR